MEDILFLVQKGADDFQEGLLGESESCHPRIQVIEYFLSKGADINLISNRREACSQICSALSINMDMIRFLVSKGADFNNDKLRTTPFHTLLQNPSCTLEMVQYLVENGVDIKKEDSLRRNCIMSHLINEEPRREIIEFFVEKGIDVNKQSVGKADGKTCLHIALQRNLSNEMIQLFLDMGSNLSIASRQMGTVSFEPSYSF